MTLLAVASTVVNELFRLGGDDFRDEPLFCVCDLRRARPDADDALRLLPALWLREDDDGKGFRNKPRGGDGFLRAGEVAAVVAVSVVVFPAWPVDTATGAAVDDEGKASIGIWLVVTLTLGLVLGLRSSF